MCQFLYDKSTFSAEQKTVHRCVKILQKQYNLFIETCYYLLLVTTFNIFKINNNNNIKPMLLYFVLYIITLFSTIVDVGPIRVLYLCKTNIVETNMFIICCSSMEETKKKLNEHDLGQRIERIYTSIHVS